MSEFGGCESLEKTVNYHTSFGTLRRDILSTESPPKTREILGAARRQNPGTGGPHFPWRELLVVAVALTVGGIGLGVGMVYLTRTVSLLPLMPQLEMALVSG